MEEQLVVQVQVQDLQEQITLVVAEVAVVKEFQIILLDQVDLV